MEPPLTPSHITIDLGEFHQYDAPEMVASQEKRHSAIEAYLGDAFSYTDARLAGSYAELVPFRTEILSAIASSIVDTTIYETKMPWGKKDLPPGEIQDFEMQLVTPVAIYEDESLTQVVNKALKKAGAPAYF